MRLIDADVFDSMLKDAQAECKRNGGNFRYGVLSTVRANLANMPTVGCWISVKDKLPETSGEYLVCIQPWDSTWRIDILGYDARSKRFGKIDLDYMYDNDGWFEIDYVTHWQELPELPKGEEE